MNSRISGILVVVATLAMHGCATMSSEECALSDWSTVGYEDGARGYTTERFSSHRKACAKHGITADFRAYQEGRDEGLVKFCQPSRGYNLGTSGRRYNGVCDVALEEEFLDAYRVGYQLYELRERVDSDNSRLTSYRQELKDIDDEISESEALLIADDTSTEDRVLLLADLKRLSERTGELEARIDQLVWDRAQHAQELADYRNTIPAYGF